MTPWKYRLFGPLGQNMGRVGAHRFAKRRLEQLNTWRPTQDELSKLHRLVNRKAGREIM
jgi:hypothetical protein